MKNNRNEESILEQAISDKYNDDAPTDIIQQWKWNLSIKKKTQRRRR